jgi:hypothetical protein
MSDETGNKLLGTTDAEVWATEFCRIFDGRLITAWPLAATHPNDDDVDTGTMIAWLGNAIETGRSAGRKETCPHEFRWLDGDLFACRVCGVLEER